MADIIIRPITPADLPALDALQRAYAALYPGTVTVPSEHYLSPAFEGGRRVLCAVEDSRVLAYAPLYVAPVEAPGQSPVLWTEIKALPGHPRAWEAKDALLARVNALAKEAAGGAAPLRLNFQYFPHEREALDYVLARGAQPGDCIYRMARDLSQPVPEVPAPAGIDICPWRMESKAEQAAYVTARNETFPEAPIQLEEWQYFVQSPMWAVGTAIGAFDGEQVVGCVAVFWDEAENRALERTRGYTEYIFVRPAWQGRGIARAMVARALAHLKAAGLDEACLEVRAANEQALGLYRGLGFQVVSESRIYVMDIN